MTDFFPTRGHDQTKHTHASDWERMKRQRVPGVWSTLIGLVGEQEVKRHPPPHPHPHTQTHPQGGTSHFSVSITACKIIKRDQANPESR